jgi:ammonia channel protein AmtB
MVCSNGVLNMLMTNFICLAVMSVLWTLYGNAGSALSADDLAGVALISTTVATGAAVLGWLFVEKIRDGKPTPWVLPGVPLPVWPVASWTIWAEP